MTDPREVFVSIDIEASGPTPGLYSMLSLGACLVDDSTQSFYLEIQPINDAFTPEALAICQFSLERLKREGTPPLIAPCAALHSGLAGCITKHQDSY
jgi:ribonuclease T